MRNIIINTNYADRSGYDPKFLEHPIALPKLSAPMQAEAAQFLAAPGSFILPYHHFSLVMNARRRLPFFTAVNIDGGLLRRLRRDPDTWQFDPRIDKAHQVGHDLYDGNDLDFGHLVRRLDPCWGDSIESARLANNDTFHLTNCAPQHARFNRNKTVWAGVEDYILKNAIAQRLRVSVFTGPVFTEADPIFRGIALPKQFWKVVMMVKADGALSCTGYLLDQGDLVTPMRDRDFAFGTYRTFQVPVVQLEAVTGLQFGPIAQRDPLLKQRGLVPSELRAFKALQL